MSIKNHIIWMEMNEIQSQCEHGAVLVLTVSKFRKSDIKKDTNKLINDSMIRTKWNKAGIETIDKNNALWNGEAGRTLESLGINLNKLSNSRLIMIIHPQKPQIPNQWEKNEHKFNTRKRCNFFYSFLFFFNAFWSWSWSKMKMKFLNHSRNDN